MFIFYSIFTVAEGGSDDVYVKYLQYISQENVHATVNLSYASLSEELRRYCT